jgi:hypothetical protein
MIRTNTVTSLLLFSALGIFGCKDAGKGQVTVHEAPVVEEPTSAEKAADEEESEGDNTAEAVEAPWATKVATQAKKLSAIATMCNEKYLSKFKPDELLVGMPALVTKDGVVTVLERDCSYLSGGYDEAFSLMKNKHPLTDKFLKDWALLADLYGRFARTSINIGAKAKRRQLNAAEMKAELPNLTKTLIPRLLRNAKELSEWDSAVVPEYPTMKAKKTEAESSWRTQFSNTAKELRELETAWITYAHDPLSKELYARRRYLGWMNSHWKERLAREKKAVMNAVAESDSKTKSLRSLGANFYEATDTWFTNAWTLGVESYADRSLIDEPKLKAAKKAFKKEGKAFDKAMRRLKVK